MAGLFHHICLPNLNKFFVTVEKNMQTLDRETEVCYALLKNQDLKRYGCHRNEHR
jgi:hypothetical protein